MDISTVQSIKLVITSATGLSKDALHIYAGLAVFFMAVMVLRKSLYSIIPWFLVLALAVAGELVDMRDDIVSLGYWRWGASAHDIGNTLFWPTVIMFLARFGVLFGALDVKIDTDDD